MTSFAERAFVNEKPTKKKKPKASSSAARAPARGVDAAVGVGVVGALVAALLLAIARVLGLRANVEATLGAITGASGSVDTREAVGMLALLGGGAFFGVVYAILFDDVFDGASPAAGALIAIPHAMLSSFVLSLLPLVARGPTPMATAFDLGMFEGALGPVGMATFFVLHVVFGVVVGIGYRRYRSADAFSSSRAVIPP